MNIWLQSTPPYSLELPTLWLNARKKKSYWVVPNSSTVTSTIKGTFVFQSFVGRQAGESAYRVAGQEVLLCSVCHRFQFHVRSNPNGGQSHGFKHAAAAREEDRDPGEQRHHRSGKNCREIRTPQLHWGEATRQFTEKQMTLILSNKMHLIVSRIRNLNYVFGGCLLFFFFTDFLLKVIQWELMDGFWKKYCYQGTVAKLIDLVGSNTPTNLIRNNLWLICFWWMLLLSCCFGSCFNPKIIW